MKTATLILTALSLLALTEQACSQDKPDASQTKLRKDPTYSTHNYKHANKAAAARRWEAGSGVAVQPPAPGNAGLANYKRQAPGQPPVGGITVGHTPSTDVADRNYKMQRPNLSPAPEGVARKRGKRPDTTNAAGNE